VAWRRVGAALAVALVASFGTVFASAAPASAHGQFVRSDPAAGATVSSALETIYVYFSEKPTSNAFFAVTAPSGARVDRLWSHGPTEPILEQHHEWYHQPDGSWAVKAYTTAYSAEIPIAYWPENGAYKVAFLSVATDGEPVRGEFTFTYAGPVTPLPADYSPQRNEPDPNLLQIAPPGAPTAPPTGPPLEEVVAAAEAGPSAWIVWVPIGIVVAIVIAALIYWRARPEHARELVVSRFGGRYAAPAPRRPQARPSVPTDRLPARLGGTSRGPRSEAPRGGPEERPRPPAPRTGSGTGEAPGAGDTGAQTEGS